MRKTIWLLPIFFGVLLGFSNPSDSATTRTYTAQILPGGGSSGQSVRLNCGWHGGSCGSGSGDYLDWDNTSTYTAYFRGIFKRSGASRETSRLKGFQIRTGGGDRECDAQDVAVIHSPTSTLLGYTRFLHISTNNTGYFSLPTSGDGEYYSKSIGTMVTDTGCGSWNGEHVHQGYKSGGSASRSKNSSRFPSGDYCQSGSCYKNFTNNSSSNWTHKFTWTGE
ncbi:MAG: hypothetical protein KBD16_01420 [Candidatus Pacebacteria bacterium]|nr:hypothetical protein [Candidatus Paceibacterota bacterium]